jgi:hypothetical protein
MKIVAEQGGENAAKPVEGYIEWHGINMNSITTEIALPTPSHNIYTLK